MDTINEILLRSSLIFLWVFSFVGAIVGVVMVLQPSALESINRIASFWVNTEQVERQLDKPRWTERFFYRYHRVTGGFFIVGALAILYTFLFSERVTRFKSLISPDSLWIANGIVSGLIIGAVVAALIGFLMTLRPSLLRDIETHSNRWVSTDRMSRFFNDTHGSLDKFIIKHRKLVGYLLFFGSVYILFVLGYYLWWVKKLPF